MRTPLPPTPVSCFAGCLVNQFAKQFFLKQTVELQLRKHSGLVVLPVWGGLRHPLLSAACVSSKWLALGGPCVV